MAQMNSLFYISPVSNQKAHSRILRQAAAKAFSDNNLKTDSKESVHILRAYVL